MMPTDLFHIRTYGTQAISPDGHLVAIEVHGWASGAWRDSGEVLGNINQRAELWVASTDGKKRQKLTPEGSVQLSQWDPVWSPDSQKLALLSNEGKGNAYLKVWDRSTGKVRRLTGLGVDLNVAFSQTSSRAAQTNLFWVDDTHILAVLLPAGVHSHFVDENSRGAKIASGGIAAAARGVEATAVVASSPPDGTETTNTWNAELVVIDLKTGASRVAGVIPAWQGRIARRYIVLSPNREWAAVVPSLPLTATDAIARDGTVQIEGTKLGIASIREPKRGIRWVQGVEPAPLERGYGVTINWQGDGRAFAVVAQLPGDDTRISLSSIEAASTSLRTIAVIDQKLVDADGLQISVSNISWLPDGRCVARVYIPRKRIAERRLTSWVVTGDNVRPLDPAEETLLKKIQSEPPSKTVEMHTSELGRLYTTDSKGVEATVFPALNPQLAKIEAPQSRNFEYKSASGETLYAKLLLPYGYMEGKRYPTVVRVYGGDVQSDQDTVVDRDDSNLILAGRGYAVLVPSMPLSPEGEQSDPMLHLNDGVDPAIDQAVALGIVDPDRLAVMGHSYGGYSVFGLITETHRYRAAVGMMGISDLTDFYGEFDVRYRYTDPNYAATIGPSYAESAQGRMAVPPWVDPQRYVRNSPVFVADRINTPLLIITGDLDGLTQSEEMFTALRRQGKRVEYVNYLGEQHVLGSPANVLDMWKRVLGWLDTYVKNAQAIQ